MEELLKSLYAKHYGCKEAMIMNDPSNYFTLGNPHASRCNETSHRECWAKRTRARIVLEATGRYIYLITGEPPIWCNLKGKPKLSQVTHYIVQNIEDISNTNYKYLMEVKDKLIEFGYGDKKKRGEK